MDANLEVKFTLANIGLPPIQIEELSSTEAPSTGISIVENDLFDLKSKLNVSKAKTGEFEPTEWFNYTASRHPGRSIRKQMRQLLRTRMVTQAWLKFYEIISTYPLIDKWSENVTVFNAVNLCEAPGAFVAALEFYLKTNVPRVKLNFIATSLNTFHPEASVSSCAMQDEFICDTYDSWYFGEDDTGDLLRAENIRGLVARTRQDMNIVHLITADGGFDCSNDPAHQEQMVTPLIFAEVFTALKVLHETGSAGAAFVIKMFTLFERVSVELLYLLTRTFESVDVYKPITSKSSNSEVYVICQHFRNDIDAQIIDALEARVVKQLDSAPLFKEIDERFLRQIVACGDVFSAHQIDAIEENVRLYGVDTPSLPGFLRLCNERFFNKCRLNHLLYPSPRKPGKLMHFQQPNRKIINDQVNFPASQFKWDNVHIVIGKKYDTMTSSKYFLNGIPELIEFEAPNLTNIKNFQTNELLDFKNPQLLHTRMSDYNRFCFDMIRAKLNDGTERVIFVNYTPVNCFLAGIFHLITCACARFTVLFDQKICIFEGVHILPDMRRVFERINECFLQLDSTRTITRVLKPRVLLNNKFHNVLLTMNECGTK